MRECLRCGTQMVEDIEVTVYGSGFTIIRLLKYRPGKLFPIPYSYGTPKAAVCPKCGEVSFYLTKKKKSKKELPEV